MSTVKKCFECKGVNFERKWVPVKIRIGEHESTFEHATDVCTACGASTIPAQELGRFELAAAKMALREHPINGAILKDLRHILGLKQTELAAKLGVAPETISRWERGEYHMEPWLTLALKGLVSDGLEEHEVKLAS